MLVAARTAAWSGKPLPYLRRVAYLKSDGNQYIDTGVVPRLGFYATADVMFVNSGGGYGQVFGCYANDNGISANVTHKNAPTLFAYSNVQQIVTIPVAFGSRGIVHVGQDGFNVFGTEVSLQSVPAQFTNNLHFYLFRCNGSGTIGSFRFYSAEYFDTAKSSTSKLIPVLDLSGRPAMYDEVSGQFFYNKGKGEFTWGELDKA